MRSKKNIKSSEKIQTNKVEDDDMPESEDEEDESNLSARMSSEKDYSAIKHNRSRTFTSSGNSLPSIIKRESNKKVKKGVLVSS